MVGIRGAATRSPELTGGLFAVFPGLIERSHFDHLRAEAIAAAGEATESRLVDDAADEWRGGAPARAYLSAPGGEAQQAIYGAPALADFLTGILGRSCRPTASNGTFNYYVRPDDHLSLHRDVAECDVAVITCLHRLGSGYGRHGSLVLYPGCAGLPLAAARAADADSLSVDLAEGETLVMLGGMVPHRLLPLAAGQERVVSILCFTAG